MPDENELTGGLDFGGGVRRFAADEMVACDECARSNPPTRMNCLYCGAALPRDERSALHLRPVLRRLEEWEAGRNVILLPRAGAISLASEKLNEAATLLRLEPSQLSSFLAAGTALPLARAESVEETDLIERRLDQLGLSIEIVTDEELMPDEAPRRARAFEFNDEGFAAFLTSDSEPVVHSWPDVALLVFGRIVSRRVEVEERQGRLKSRGEVIEAREMASDEGVLDIYARGGIRGLRVMAGGFDYSCLGARKSLLASENFGALVRLLRERATEATFDDAYVRVRRLLAAAWPPSERTGSGGLRRERPGRFNTEAVTHVSNETQFTRYSRLRRSLAQRGWAEKS